MSLRVTAVICAGLLAFFGCSQRPSSTPSGEATPPADSLGPETSVDSEPTKAEVTQADDPILRAVSAEERTVEDRELDAQRKPVELLRFFKVAPGQRVLELAAGRGYTTELLARVVGPEGKVYGQNSPFILERFAEVPWTARLKTPSMANVVRIDSEFDAPLPAEATGLDAVFLVLFYHDTVWFETNRAKMNQAVFAALKPGGIYAVVDHSAKSGEGISVAKSLHRIEEQVLRKEIEAAGFELEAEADFLRNPEDARDWNASPSAAAERRGESDRFVLRFVKPKNSGVGKLAGSASPEEAAGRRTECSEPRKSMCTREYRPVCADVDTGVRCIKAPCPALEKKSFSNGCSACADSRVQSYAPGACSASE